MAKAKNFIGLPYRWGGTSPASGFDCSGFMQYVYKQTANINLPQCLKQHRASG
ncbi:MAG: NlpC/P60 family protein [Moraxella osloensis]